MEGGGEMRIKLQRCHGRSRVARPQDMSPGRELKLPRRDGLKIYTVKATDTRDSLIFRYGRTVEEQLTGRGLYPGMQIYIKVPPGR